MDRSESGPAVNYTLDEHTNRFLKEYPVNCELRKLPLGQSMLHAHNGYEFYYCLDGTGTYIVGDRLHTLKAGTLTVIHPQVVHRPYSAKQGAFHRYVLSIDDAYLDRIQTVCFRSAPSPAFVIDHGSSHSGHYFLSVQQQSELSLLLSGLEKALLGETPYRELAVLKSVAEFLIFLMNVQNSPSLTETAETEDERIVSGVLAYLIAFYQEKLQIEDLLRLYPVSRTRLFAMFKVATGMTIKQFLTEYRLNQARRMLLQTSTPITEIALHTGFGDMSHFFHVFKRETGLSPKKYRDEAARLEAAPPKK